MMKTVQAITFFQSTSSICLALVLAEHHLTHLRLLLHSLTLLPLPLTVGRVLELVSVFMLCSCSAASDTNIPLLSHSVRNGKIIMRTASRALNLYCSSQPSMVHWLSSSIFPFCSSSFVPLWLHPTKSPLLLPLDPQTHTFSESL